MKTVMFVTSPTIL